MKTRRGAFSALCFAGLLVVVACGSSTKTATPTTLAAGTPATAAPGGTTAPAGTTPPAATTAGGTTAPVGASILNGEIKCTQQYAGKEVHILSPVVDSANDHPIPQFVDAYKPLAD